MNAKNRFPTNGTGFSNQVKGLDFDVDDLTSAIHSVVRIDAVRAKSAAVDRIGGDLRCLHAIGGAAFGAAGFGLLAFWICHDLCLLAETNSGKLLGLQKRFYSIRTLRRFVKNYFGPSLPPRGRRGADRAKGKIWIDCVSGSTPAFRLNKTIKLLLDTSF